MEALTTSDFDVLVTDILMPKMDGIELTAKAKKLKPRLPIIILSAAGDVDTSLKAMRAGAYCYVPKPADMEELSLFIERAMLADRLEKGTPRSECPAGLEEPRAGEGAARTAGIAGGCEADRRAPPAANRPGWRGRWIGMHSGNNGLGAAPFVAVAIASFV